MKLDLLLFNVQDLFVFMDKYQGEDLETMREPEWQLLSTSFYPNKSLQKLFSLKRIIQESDPDIIMLVEVGGRQSLENFNVHFLNGAYKVYFEESNSDRGIDIGFLCKRDFPDGNFYLVSHNNVRLKNGKKFARGLLELRLMAKGQIVAAFFLTHLKSKLDLKKEDFEGRGQRGAEVRFMVKQYQKMRQKHPKIPVFVCGDLNGIIYKDLTEEELQPLLKAGLRDVLEILEIPPEQRPTYYYFNKQHQRVPMQLDYILVDPKFSKIVSPSSRVLEMEPDLVPHPPEGMAQKRKLPSDHYPLFCRLNLQN